MMHQDSPEPAAIRFTLKVQLRIVQIHGVVILVKSIVGYNSSDFITSKRALDLPILTQNSLLPILAAFFLSLYWLYCWWIAFSDGIWGMVLQIKYI